MNGVGWGPGLGSSETSALRGGRADVPCGWSSTIIPVNGFTQTHPHLQVETSVLCADKMLIAWYHQHKAEVFAVLTDDSDFFVYGVHKV